jgi:hypothetical protein
VEVSVGRIHHHVSGRKKGRFNPALLVKAPMLRVEFCELYGRLPNPLPKLGQD